MGSRPLRPLSLDLPGGLPAEGWLRLLAGERGLVLFDRPDEAGRPASYLSFDPAPGSPLDYAPPGLDGPPPAPFFGGWAGAISYDLGRRFERLPARARDEGWPDAAGGVYRFAVAVEEGGARTRLVGAAPDGAGEGDLRRLRDRLAAGAEGALRGDLPPRPGGPALDGPLRSNVDRRAHEAAVARCVEYVHAGDAFQVNIARRAEGALAVPPVEAALRLRASNPAPRGAVVSCGEGRWVLSSSPELLLEARDGIAVSRPIKGTRPRTGDPAADAAARADLLGSEKEAAELAMIVDLERNDLGRVAEWGGVRVAAARVVEEHPTVFHTAASVEARLRPGTGPAALLRALFPGGSVTGAPKIRAMEIIEELEPVRRGPYTGSAGWFGPDGAAHLDILIRTLAVDGRRVHFGLGGGITADSDPAAEWEETVAKGVALARALGSAPV
jgi:para-aminobenzoate synthetase component 1